MLLGASVVVGRPSTGEGVAPGCPEDLQGPVPDEPQALCCGVSGPVVEVCCGVLLLHVSREGWGRGVVGHGRTRPPEAPGRGGLQEGPRRKVADVRETVAQVDAVPLPHALGPRGRLPGRAGRDVGPHQVVGVGATRGRGGATTSRRPSEVFGVASSDSQDSPLPS